MLIFFDIDGTLYTNYLFVQEQIDVQVRHWADLEGMTHKEAREKIADFRKKYGFMKTKEARLSVKKWLKLIRQTKELK